MSVGAQRGCGGTLVARVAEVEEPAMHEKLGSVRKVGSPIAVTTVINMLHSGRRRRELVYQIKPPSHNI